LLQFLQFLLPSRLLQPILKPIARLLLGVIAIPLFRVLMRKVVRVQEVDEELEKDLEQWFRGSLLLLVATKNMEKYLFPWATNEEPLNSYLFMAGRLLLAIGVIEGMPDQALFALIHPGPQKPDIEKGKVFRSLLRYIPQLMRGLLCQHLNRASPVFAIMSVFQAGTVGWVCYGLAIAQYLLIGLVTSKDKALDVLSKFDEAVNRQRLEIESQLELHAASRISAAERMKSTNQNIDSL
jgi:hypothetical protein